MRSSSYHGLVPTKRFDLFDVIIFCTSNIVLPETCKGVFVIQHCAINCVCADPQHKTISIFKILNSIQYHFFMPWLFDDQIEMPTYSHFCSWQGFACWSRGKGFKPSKAKKWDDQKIEPKLNTTRPSLHLHLCHTDLLKYMIPTFCADCARLFSTLSRLFIIDFEIWCYSI